MVIAYEQEIEIFFALTHLIELWGGIKNRLRDLFILRQRCFEIGVIVILKKHRGTPQSLGHALSAAGGSTKFNTDAPALDSLAITPQNICFFHSLLSIFKINLFEYLFTISWSDDQFTIEFVSF
ncbi:hypothetical protein ACJX0J_023444 [Zea mays]